MRRVLKFLFMLFILQIKADNPTSIIKPHDGPDPGYIIAESDTGLGNRLRVLAAYMHIGEARFEGAHLAFIWDINAACPSHFLEIFQPIQNVMFATNSSRYVLDKHAKIVYENSNAILEWILRMNHIPRNKFGQPTWGQIEYNQYKKFRPTPKIMSRITDFVTKFNICNSNAMHIRMTDLAADMKKKKKHVNLQAYFDHVDSLPAAETVYLMTDNAETQKKFIDKYGNKKILVYENISPILSTLDGKTFNSVSELMAEGTTDETIATMTKSDTNIPSDIRHTTLEHTLIDVLIAAHAKEFKPAIYSSLSDVVKIFKNIGRNEFGWCKS